jgi:hypothetical protein
MALARIVANLVLALGTHLLEELQRGETFPFVDA